MVEDQAVTSPSALGVVRWRRVVRVLLPVQAALVLTGGVWAETRGGGATVDPLSGYLHGAAPFGPGATPLLAMTLAVAAVAVAVPAWLHRNVQAADRLLRWGHYWLLLIVPALFGNLFDAFIGHGLFVLAFIGAALACYLGWHGAGKAGLIVGLFVSVFYGTDGTGDFVRGGPWNTRAVTLSSPAVTHTAWGLLAFVSDMVVLMALAPLTYDLLGMVRPLATWLWGVALLLAVVPRLALLPVVGFQPAFSGWVSLLSGLAWPAVLTAIVLVAATPAAALAPGGT